MINIFSNGSKWMGQEPDSIQELLNTLKEYTLDPSFEQYGNFITVLQESDFLKVNDTIKERIGKTHFFGNFYNVSHVFNIDTDEPFIIEALTTAIRKNQQTAEYKEAKKERFQCYSLPTLERDIKELRGW